MPVGFPVVQQSQTKLYERPIELVAHRGYASIQPQNTMRAFKNAIVLGAHTIEMDVQISSDGVPVLFHDGSVDSLTDGTGTVTALTASYLASIHYDNPGCLTSGIPLSELVIPTFADLCLLAAKCRQPIMPEIKAVRSQSDIAIMMGVVSAAGISDLTTWQSGSLSNLQYVRSINPSAKLAYFGTASTLANIQAEIGVTASLGNALYFNATGNILANPSLVYYAFSRGVEVMAYTTSTMAQVASLTAIGVYRIFSDVPIDMSSITGSTSEQTTSYYSGYAAGSQPVKDDVLTLGALPNGVSITRNLQGSYYDSNGLLSYAAVDTARFQHNPNTLEPEGILVEPERTNLFLYSEDLSNVAWSKSTVTVDYNAATAPDGTQTADLIIPNTVTGAFKEVLQNVSCTTGTIYTFSAFVKAGGYNFVQIIGQAAFFPNMYINFDLSNGTITGSGGLTNVKEYGMEPIKDGWYRIWASVVCSSTGTSRMVTNVIPEANSTRGVSWTPDGVSGIYHWGHMMEVGKGKSSYIPTTSVPVTRGADDLIMSSPAWLSKSGGLIAVEAKLKSLPSAGNKRWLFQANDGSASNWIGAYVNENGYCIGSIGVYDVETISDAYASSLGVDSRFKTVVSYGTGASLVASNGNICSPSVSFGKATIPSNIKHIRIGNNYQGTDGAIMTVRRVMCWDSPKRPFFVSGCSSI